MKHLRLLLVIFAASIGAMQTALARTAPTLPEAKTLEIGKNYYLYNANTDRFISFSTNTSRYYLIARTDQGQAVSITQVSDSQYKIMFIDGSNYWYYWSPEYFYTYSPSNTDKDNFYFNISEVENGYTIQSVYNNNPNNFIGYDGRNGDRIYPDIAEGNIVWQLMDDEEAARYIAKRNLYRALEAG